MLLFYDVRTNRVDEVTVEEALKRLANDCSYTPSGDLTKIFPCLLKYRDLNGS